MTLRSWVIKSTTLCISSLLLLSTSPQSATAEGEQNISSDTFSATFDLVGISRCMFGDLDALLLDLKTAAGTLGLQLSLEDLSSDSGSIIYGNALEEKTAANNFGSYTVSLPKSETTTVYGAFLCSIDREHDMKAPCSSQKLKSAEELLRPYRVDSSALGGMQKSELSAPYSPPKSAKPTIFYAHFFSVTAGTITPLSESDATGIAAALTPKGIAKEKIAGITKTIARYANSISSLPLGRQEGRLQMQLPYYDQGKCMGK